MTAVDPKRSIIAGQLYKALALRYLSLIASLSRDAERYGVEVGIPHPAYGAIHDSYLAAVGVVVSESPSSIRDARALAEFAAAVTADNPVFEALNECTPVGDAQDRHHVVLALRGVCDWLNTAEVAEFTTACRVPHAAA